MAVPTTLALVALFALAATAAANGDKEKAVPFTAPCNGGACAALASLDDLKRGKTDGFGNTKCAKAVANLCTLTTGSSPGCDQPTRDQVLAADQALAASATNAFAAFYGSVTTFVDATYSSATGRGDLVVTAACPVGQVAVGGACQSQNLDYILAENWGPWKETNPPSLGQGVAPGQWAYSCEFTCDLGSGCDGLSQGHLIARVQCATLPTVNAVRATATSCNA